MKTDLMPLQCNRFLSKEDPAPKLDKYFLREYEILQSG